MLIVHQDQSSSESRKDIFIPKIKGSGTLAIKETYYVIQPCITTAYIRYILTSLQVTVTRCGEMSCLAEI